LVDPRTEILVYKKLILLREVRIFHMIPELVNEFTIAMRISGIRHKNLRVVVK
jgi:hypothetical protein